MQTSALLTSRKARTLLVVGLLTVLALTFSQLQIVPIPAKFQSLNHNNASTPAAVTTDLAPVSSTSGNDAVQWSDFAYIQYVTTESYLCNSLMILEALRRHETKADLLMLYPQEWNATTNSEDSVKYESGLLAKARDTYKAKLVPIQTWKFEDNDDRTWQESYTKLLAFNQTQYKRVISLDSDATLLDNMDELFLLPSVPVAMPRAYWLDKFQLASHIMIIEPSSREWTRVQAATAHHKSGDYDMDILHKMYSGSCLVIPHRKYALLTQEFRAKTHEQYLGSADEEWDARRVYKEAKYVHFSDWPMPKPWLEAKEKVWNKHKPECRRAGESDEEDCADRDVWMEIRADFTARRERICGKAYDAKYMDPEEHVDH